MDLSTSIASTHLIRGEVTRLPVNRCGQLVRSNAMSSIAGGVPVAKRRKKKEVHAHSRYRENCPTSTRIHETQPAKSTKIHPNTKTKLKRDLLPTEKPRLFATGRNPLADALAKHYATP
ncbi:hypothetical protein K0M31_010885 [Melipona bicolor]|uniref:Uncharacterized protein n=1 Tax=Melipona bicolor TaxID=60889 RepID=A0AA40FLH4_9HYME|nr:hypothetical protein K0M31_010885 [Melipona bicolor]